MDYKDLEVWRRAVDAAVSIYDLVKGFPVEERYGLVDQMKRSAISISSNIAEGATRQTAKEFSQFLFIASGSASELESQLIICQKLNLAQAIDPILAELTIIRKQLNSLIKSIRC